MIDPNDAGLAKETSMERIERIAGVRAHFKREQRHENTELCIKQVFNLDEPSQQVWMNFLYNITKILQYNGVEIIPTLFIRAFPQLSRMLSIVLNILQGNIIICYNSLHLSGLFFLSTVMYSENRLPLRHFIIPAHFING